jgi:hypothetical protein
VRGLAWRSKVGATIAIDAKELQANQALWDLVYNGILYSVQRGSAKADQRAIDKLKLR